MFVERKLMTKLGLDYADATALVAKAHITLGLRHHTRDRDVQVYREARRIHAVQQEYQMRRLHHDEREENNNTRRPWRSRSRASVAPL